MSADIVNVVRARTLICIFNCLQTHRINYGDVVSPIFVCEALEMIDIQTEKVLTFTQAAKALPGRPNVATLWRWRTAGCRGVKLETVLVGGKRYTSREAIQRFVAETTAAADGEAVQPRTPKQRAANHARADADLAKAGF